MTDQERERIRAAAQREATKLQADLPAGRGAERIRAAERESERIRAAARARAATAPPITPEVAARIAPLIQAGLEQADRDEKASAARAPTSRS